MIKEVYDIQVGNESYGVNVEETSVKQITINNEVYVVPVAVANFINKLSKEIKKQQEQKITTESMINGEINRETTSIANALSKAGMLAYPLEKETSAGHGYECDDQRTFYDDVRDVIRPILRARKVR